VVTPFTPSYAKPVWHLYVARAPDREALARALAADGIASGIHYPTPPHLQPALAGTCGRAGDFPVTEGLAASILSLPLYPELPEWVPQAVADAVRRSQPDTAVAEPAAS
jgi:dTDP-4-amino-4,6-dideoxygalactose transaminase